VLTALVGWAGTAVAERNAGVAPMLAVLGAGQASLHVLLDHVADGHSGGRAGPVLPSAQMFAAHVVATLLAAVLLSRASVAFAAVAAALTGLVRAIAVALSPPAVPASHAPVETAGGHLVDVVLRRSLGRRGPPVLS
jgi:hypothetical protein